MIESVWATRLDSKVVPEWLSLIDDPTQQKFEGAALAGQYRVDDEGVPVERLVLVDKGVLKGFLLSREPVRKFNGSNGHGRLPGRFGSEDAVIGNLFVEAQGGIPEEQMKAKIDREGKVGRFEVRIDYPSFGLSLPRQISRSCNPSPVKCRRADSAGP